jgi:hypothetical protein
MSGYCVKESDVASKERGGRGEECVGGHGVLEGMGEE